MAITVESFAGVDIQTATYEAYLDAPDRPYLSAIEPVTVSPLDRPPLYVRGRTQIRTVVVHVQIKSGGLRSGWETLAETFTPGKRGALIGDFDGTRRALDCVARQVIPHDGGGNQFTAVLIAANPYWRNEDVQRASQAITSSPTTWSLSNGGNHPDREPVVRIQPYRFRAAADGQRYKREIIIANQQPRPFANYAIEVTEGWDHAAEVAAGRSLASGDDVKLLLNGVEIPRWDGENAATDWNSATTNIWGNINLAPMKTAALFANITSTSVLNGEDLEVRPGGTKGWPAWGAFRLNDECFHYYGTTAKNANGREAFRNVFRGARNTTAASHTAGDTLYWVEHRVQLVQGDTGAGAYTEDTKTKPLLDLTSATLSNLRHEWLAFGDDDNPGRSMAWSRRLRSDDDHAGRILAPSGAPDTVLDWEHQSGGPTAGKPNFNTWYRDVPSGTGSSGGNVMSLTRVVDDTLALLVRGFDADGQEVSLATYNGGLASAAVNITAPTNPVYRVEGYVRDQVMATTPNGAGLSGDALPGKYAGEDTAADFDFQRITVPAGGTAPVTIKSINVWVNAATADQNATLAIFSDSSGSPGSRISAREAVSILTASGNHWKQVTLTTPLEVVAGQVIHVGMQDNSNDGNIISWYTQRIAWEGTGTPRELRVFSDNSGFDAQAVATDGGVVTVDGVTLHLATAGVPYVSMRAREDAYFLDGTFRNLTTGQALAFATPLGIADVVEVDVRERAIRNLSEGPFALTMSGNEITDVTRALSSADGTPTQGDGVAPPAGHTGIWKAATNLVTNGGAETNTTGWVTGGTNVFSRSTDQKKFGAASFKCEWGNSVVAGQFGITLTAAQHVYHAWLYIPTAYDGGAVQLEAADFTSATGTLGPVSADMDLRDQWQQVIVGPFTPDAGDLAGNLQVRVATLPTAGRVIHWDGVQCEASAFATPYVETDGGTAARAAARVRIPVESLFSEEQGAVVLRVRSGAANTSHAGDVNLFDWRDDGSNFLLLRYRGATALWRFDREGSGTGVGVTVADTFARAADITVGAAWNRTQEILSIDGAAQVAATNTAIPSLAATQADIGSLAGVNHFTCDVRWAAFFQGTLTDADYAALNDYGNNVPTFTDLSRDLAATALPTAIWDGGLRRFFRAGEPRGASVVQTVRPSDKQEWLRIDPGANVLEYEESGVLGVQVRTATHGRWL